MMRNRSNKEERTDSIRMFRFNFVSIFLAKKAFFNIMIKIQIKIKKLNNLIYLSCVIDVNNKRINEYIIFI